LEENITQRPIVEAWKQSTRPERAMIAILLFAFFALAIFHLGTWVTHKFTIRPELMALGVLLALAICVWHAWMVKGRRQAVAFFAIAWLITWACEFVGHNYAWFFGYYKYTDTLRPRVGGVPIVVIVTWSVVIYAAYMLIDWLAGTRGIVRAKTWLGKTLWGVIIAAASATLVCAWDLMVDPMATSRVWMQMARVAPWWWWERGGPYLKGLNVWKGNSGVPIGNFVGWWLAPFFIVFIFYMVFQKRNLTSEKLVNIVPLFIYFALYFSTAMSVLEMNWFENGMNQVALIGTFAMMPVVLVSAIKLAMDYTRPALI